MRKIAPLISFLVTVVSFSHAQSPTWSTDVASIIYANCSNCHHEGGIGPFSLMTYQDAVDHAYSVQAQVQSKLMPPWKPDPDYVHFKDERILSGDDISTIADWVTAGTPSGDLSLAPPPPVFQTGSQLQVTDRTLQTPAYTVTSDVDDYRTFVIHSNFTEDVFLNQIEYLPGNGSIVHHIVLFYDPTNFSWNQDQDDPLPGYESYGVGPINDDSYIIGAWAPGSGIFSLPGNMGIRIPAGADFGIEVHYAPGSNEKTDSSIVNLKFTAAQPDIREVYVDALLNHFNNLTDGPLSIPANTVRTFHEEFDWQYGDMSVISIFPHMHLIGSSFKVWSLDENNDTTRLISIPKWAFHWQGFYEYQKPVHITDPSQLWAEASYDNTTNNADNPSNPPQDVEAGEHTTDEMMLSFFTYTEYMLGDEDIILDSSLISSAPLVDPQNSILQVYPNPVRDQLTLYFNGQQPETIQIDLLNEECTIVKHWNRHASGNKEQMTYSLNEIPAGMYVVKVSSPSSTYFAKVIKQ